MLKKSLSIALVTLIFATGISKANAYSLEDAMADITSLKTQIVDLKSQLSAAVITTKSDTTVSTLRNPEVTPATTKATITFTSPKNITPNAKGEDVITLQNALKEAGYFTASVTGNYGAVTEKAVKAFQKANNLPATGVVGNLTKSLLTNPSNPPAPSQSCATTTAASWVKVLAPNGGETYTAGQQITIKWITCSLLVNNNMTIGIKNSAGVIVAVLTQSTPNDGVQTFNIPSTLQTGQYKVYVNTVYNGITYSDQSDNTFSINSPTLSSCNPNVTTPSIKVISPNGGEVYTAGQQVTVKWVSCNIPANQAVLISLQGNFNQGYQLNNLAGLPFDPSMLNDGIEVVTLPTLGSWNLMQFGEKYKIKVVTQTGTATDLSDNLFTINAAPACISTSQPSITVLSPNGGEVYTAGQQITVKWTSCNVPNTLPVFINLEGNNNVTTNIVDATQGILNDGSELVTLPTQSTWQGMQFGQIYKIRVGVGPFGNLSGSTSDNSDNLFTINAGTTCTPGSQPSVTVLSPNGGETFTAGQQITITWTSCNLPSNQQLNIGLIIPSSGGFATYIVSLSTPNDGIEVVTLPTNNNWTNMVFGNFFKIELRDSANTTLFVPEWSDNLFTVTPLLPAGCTSVLGFSSVNGTPCWLMTQYLFPGMTSTSATLGGYLFDGAPATITWNLTPSNPSLPSPYVTSINGVLSAYLTGLTPNTNYQYNVCGLTAANQYGCGVTRSFQTFP